MDGRLWSRWMVVKTEPLINITESQVIMSKNWGSKGLSGGTGGALSP